MLAFSKKRRFRRAGSWRTCAGCGRRLPRREALRLVRAPDGFCKADPERKIPGRGMHLCWKFECWQEAERKKAAFRHLGARLQPHQIRQQLGLWLREEIKRLWQVCLHGKFLLLDGKEVEKATSSGCAALLLLKSGGMNVDSNFVPFRHVPSHLWPGPAELDRAAIVHRGLGRKMRRLLDLLKNLEQTEAKRPVSCEEGKKTGGFCC